MSPLPFFCAICDKPIVPSNHRKHNLVHDKCMDQYLSNFDIPTKDDIKQSTTTSKDKT
jgi:hypothetical protein